MFIVEKWMLGLNIYIEIIKKLRKWKSSKPENFYVGKEENNLGLLTCMRYWGNRHLSDVEKLRVNCILVDFLVIS